MKKLSGNVYLYPTTETNINALTEYDSENKTWHYISGLLGLPTVPEKWVKVCTFDTDCFGESDEVREGKSDDWYHKGYTVEGSPGILPFPEYLPVDFFTEIKVGDVLSFRYGDMDVCLTRKGFAHDSCYHRSAWDIHNDAISLPSKRYFPEAIFDSPQLKDKTAEPREQKNNKLPAFAPIIFAALGVVGIACIIALGIAGAASEKG